MNHGFVTKKIIYNIYIMDSNKLNKIHAQNHDEENMDLVNECRFCGIAQGKFKYAKIDQPIIENQEYMAFASIGALVPGWTLVSPRIHDVSMRAHYEKEDFHFFVHETIKRLRKSYSNLIAFEHGANKQGSVTACGTEHAHLHLVPFSKSLLQDMSDSGLFWKKCKASEIKLISEGKEYLFYSEITDDWNKCEGFIHILEKPISQFFRKIIATHLGLPNQFDYKTFPNFENSTLTYKTLSEMAS